jgi:flagellar biosynthesis GTPase FlhF
MGGGERTMNKKILIPALAVAIGGGLLYTASNASAYFGWGNGEYPPIVEDMVEKFNLNEEEVKTYFDEQRQEHQQQMQQHKEERLNQAVEDGVISEEQKQALQDKWQEMWQERQSEREQQREEMEAWFEEQGIDQDALMQYGGFGGRGFGKMGMGMGRMPPLPPQ